MSPNLETFCPLPWLQISTTPMATLSMCCDSQLYVPNVSFKKFMNSPEMHQLRKDLARGLKSPLCKNCWRKEAEGGRSTRVDQVERVLRERGPDGPAAILRESEAQRFFMVSPEQLDMKFGNLCNLKCRMCTPANSSKIWSEYESNREDFDEFKGDFVEAAPYYRGELVLPPMDELLEASAKITRLNISGGEPMIMKPVLEYIDRLVEEGLSKNILLTFNSNGTNVNWKTMERFRQFRQVELYLSVDGTEQTYEYIRFPAKWEALAKNLVAIRDFVGTRHEFSVQPTYQALNVLNMADLLEWCKRERVVCLLGNSVIHPNYHSPHALPSAIRHLGARRLEEWGRRHELNESERGRLDFAVEHLMNDEPYQPELFRKFQSHNVLLDRLRGQSLREQLPELYAMIEAAS